MMKRNRQTGVVQTLCEEIGVEFHSGLESTAVLVEFVTVLVDEISEMMFMDSHLEKLGGTAVSVGAKESLECVKSLLLIKDREKLIKHSENAHRVTHVPDEGKCDHYIDMLSSCVSAIRFGLEMPCNSRHAAEAANHVWKHKYGITLFDKYSNKFGRYWAKEKFYEALCRISSS